MYFLSVWYCGNWLQDKGRIAPGCYQKQAPLFLLISKMKIILYFYLTYKHAEVSSQYVKLMDDCLSEDPQARPTFASIVSNGSLSPGLYARLYIIFSYGTNFWLEELNITLDSLISPQDWGEPFAHGSTASIYRARVRNSRSTIAVKRLNVPLNNATSMIMNERITCLADNRHPNLARVCNPPKLQCNSLT